MLVKRISKIVGGEQAFAIYKNNAWHIIEKNHTDVFDVLAEQTLLQSDESVSLKMVNSEEYKELIPFKPTSFRDFMLYEKHAIDAARGFVKKYLPAAYPVVRLYEKITKQTFPMLKPGKRYYRYPIYYLGNHINFFSEGDEIQIPSYTKELDYELEIAAVIAKPLKNATIQEVEDAIGGFVILNDFTARDQQMDEMKSGFGPMKTKNFANAISSTLASKDAILPLLDTLTVQVCINGKSVIKTTSAHKKYSIQEAIAYASWEEQLHPGELFGSGTIPGCTGIENGVMLHKGDTIKLEVEGIGSLTNHIA